MIAGSEKLPSSAEAAEEGSRGYSRRLMVNQELRCVQQSPLNVFSTGLLVLCEHALSDLYFVGGRAAGQRRKEQFLENGLIGFTRL